jgi:F420H(2)-dependent quinone reductase
MQPKPGWRSFSYGLLATRPASWFFARVLPIADRLAFLLSGGRQTLVSAMAGLPSVILTTTGAKSGKRRDTTLLGIPDGKRFIIVASNWGGKHHPNWYYNLRANPTAEVSCNGKTAAYVAREVTGVEREECWTRAVNYYNGYAVYAQRTQREIHVFVLAPKK